MTKVQANKTGPKFSKEKLCKGLQQLIISYERRRNTNLSNTYKLCKGLQQLIISYEKRRNTNLSNTYK